MSVPTAHLGHAKNAWKVLKEVSLAKIREEAECTVTVAIVGPADTRRAALGALYPGYDEQNAHPGIRMIDSASADDGFPEDPSAYDILLVTGDVDLPDETAANIYRADEFQNWDDLTDRMLEIHPEWGLPLARRFPGLRDRVCRKIIRDTASANAEIAMLNALPGFAPLLGLLIPTAAIADLLILGKNQAMMLYRLAAAHGLSLDYRARTSDLAPLLGNAFGWRAIGREVIGFVPGGVGLVARGVIAYAGTQALGQALHRAYSSGKTPTRGEVNSYYHRSLGEARQTVNALWENLRAQGARFSRRKGIEFRVERCERPPDGDEVE